MNKKRSISNTATLCNMIHIDLHRDGQFTESFITMFLIIFSDTME